MNKNKSTLRMMTFSAVIFFGGIFLGGVNVTNGAYVTGSAPVCTHICYDPYTCSNPSQWDYDAKKACPNNTINCDNKYDCGSRTPIPGVSLYYVCGYDSCTADTRVCHYLDAVSWNSCVAGIQTSNRVWDSVAGGSCSDDPASRTCGLCGTGAGVPSSNPVNLCAAGTPVNLTHNVTTWTWTCNAASPINCSAPYVPSPTVTLSANPAAVNLNNGTATIAPKQVNLTWGISNVATACNGGCTCTASGAWSGAKSYPGTEPVWVNSGADPTYTLTCTNNYNGTGTRSTTVTSTCTPHTYYDDCDVECDSGQRACHYIDNECHVGPCASVGCTMPPCPVSSQYKEVRP